MSESVKPRPDGRWAALVALLLLAFGVRVHNLAGQSFWWDEAYSVLLVERGLRALLQELKTFDFHPPLYYLLVRVWLPIGGRSEFALRFLSVASGCLTVAIGARLGRRLYGGRGGLAAGAIFALSPFLWYYSQEARMYAPTALLATLALYLLHRALEEGRWLLWLAYSVVCALGLYAFYYFVFVPVFGGVYLVLLWRRHRHLAVRWVAVTAVTLLLYAPWVPVLLGRNAVWDSLWATTSSPLKTASWSWLTLILGLPDLDLYRQPVPAALLAVLGLSLALEVARRWRGALRPYLFALLGFALPIALMAAIATVKPVFHPRYAVAAAPALLLAFAGVVAGCPRQPKGDAGDEARGSGVSAASGTIAVPDTRRDPWRLLSPVAGVALLLGAIYGLGNLMANPAYARDDYRAAVAHVEARLQPGDAVIYNADPGFRYYYRGSAPARFFPGPPYEEARIAEGLNALAAGKRRLWYVRHFEVPTDPEGFVERQLDGHASRLEEVWFGSLRVTLYALPPTPGFEAAALTRAEANFADRLLLTGYSLAAPEVPSGGKVELTLRWQVLRPLEDYGVWVGLGDERGLSWGREDRRPRNRDLQLSSRWQPGEIVTTRHQLPALIGTPPASYRLEIGVYRLDNLRGLDLLDDQGRPRGQSFSPTSVRVVRAAGHAEADPSLPSQPRAKLAEDVELAAYRVDAGRASPGGRLRLTLLWRALSQPDHDYSVALRLVSTDGHAITRSDERPADGRYPTRGWQPGELVREQRELRLPPNASAGRFALQVALVSATVGAAPAWFSLGEVELDAVKRQFDEPEIPRRVDVDVGGQFRLLGGHVEPTSVRPGSRLRLILYWRALADGQHSYRVFTHLADAQGKIWGQRDGEPRNWTHPTSAWLEGEVVEDVYEIEVQAETPSGQYAIVVGMYDPQTGERLRVSGLAGEERGDHVVLQAVEVR